MMDDAIIDALCIAQSALIVAPEKRGRYQQACIVLAAEIHRLNGEIGELYRVRTPVKKEG